MDQVLIDTNILIYAHQPSETLKYERALRTVESLGANGVGCISAQILAEFLSATMRGRHPILPVHDALHQATVLANVFRVLDLTALIVLEAARGVREHQLSYFDAQIWATARLNQVPVIFTEDFIDGRRVEGVQFLNPLVATFDLAKWS
ncbi:MAG: PIN domain-containing protein [Acidobacteria bacterium]|nr:PIN domain-containing protein [Acidobacteriota bacterium]MBV9070088.1 PIN domain-containing protein [Acidobacteriota bacterium]MBV9185453.1 PIN domain-containing protein [Acidobacteriota bacterium]